MKNSSLKDFQKINPIYNQIFYGKNILWTNGEPFFVLEFYTEEA